LEMLLREVSNGEFRFCFLALADGAFAPEA
jgi:hypothetical protein